MDLGRGGTRPTPRSREHRLSRRGSKALPTDEPTGPGRGERACEQPLSHQSGGGDLNSRPLRPEDESGDRRRTYPYGDAWSAGAPSMPERLRLAATARWTRDGTPCLQTVRLGVVVKPDLEPSRHGVASGDRRRPDRIARVWPTPEATGRATMDSMGHCLRWRRPGPVYRREPPELLNTTRNPPRRMAVGFDLRGQVGEGLDEKRASLGGRRLVADSWVRRRDSYPEEAEPSRTVAPEDAWLLSAFSWVMVSSG
jgi:hypothetical protein